MVFQEEQDHAASQSAFVNGAYRTLKDPLARAYHLVSRAADHLLCMFLRDCNETSLVQLQMQAHDRQAAVGIMQGCCEDLVSCSSIHDITFQMLTSQAVIASLV